MNKQVCGMLKENKIPYHIHNSHKQYCLEISLEIEHFENLRFSGLRLKVRAITSRQRTNTRNKFSWIIEIWKVELESTQSDKKNQQVVLETKEFKFSVKLASKLKLFKNRSSFELNLSFWDVINSIMGIRNFNLDLKTLSSPILASLAPSQIDRTEMVENSSSNSSPGELTNPNAPVELRFPTVREGCAKTESVRCNKIQTYYQILFDW